MRHAQRAHLQLKVYAYAANFRAYCGVWRLRREIEIVEHEEEMKRVNEKLQDAFQENLIMNLQASVHIPICTIF